LLVRDEGLDDTEITAFDSAGDLVGLGFNNTNFTGSANAA
jgi:hypothetical protein